MVRRDHHDVVIAMVTSPIRAQAVAAQPPGGEMGSAKTCRAIRAEGFPAARRYRSRMTAPRRSSPGVRDIRLSSSARRTAARRLFTPSLA